ncbi:hypothetical protein CAPTEDRAFT_223456 [Capitella teleta]|uniref:Ig-like domain-containing protein n=1 Tax=Capitella teleta TaxID=283909 RepID=R7TTQ4_CAPTE|nr:hypothetical protein CAPTEDRAFT_223456 [Capitella teleta]|eukprot:ELT96997.1 hypothetical protein CAPTEDRAFT_223456 [Capitella teleta]
MCFQIGCKSDSHVARDFNIQRGNLDRMKKEERVAMDIRCHGNPMSSAATGSETSQMHTSKRCRSHFVNGHKLCLNLPAKSLRSNSNISLCAFSSTSTKVFTKSLRISWRLIFAVTLFQFVHQVQGQQWVVAPSNTSARLGETVTLRCEGKDLGSRSTEWRQYSDAGTDRTLFFNDQRVTDNERYSALSNGNGFDLQISQLSRDDDAHYQCSFTLSELSVRARLTTLGEFTYYIICITIQMK